MLAVQALEKRTADLAEENAELREALSEARERLTRLERRLEGAPASEQHRTTVP